MITLIRFFIGFLYRCTHLAIWASNLKLSLHLRKQSIGN